MYDPFPAEKTKKLRDAFLSSLEGRGMLVSRESKGWDLGGLKLEEGISRTGRTRRMAASASWIVAGMATSSRVDVGWEIDVMPGSVEGSSESVVGLVMWMLLLVLTWRTLQTLSLVQRWRKWSLDLLEPMLPDLVGGGADLSCRLRTGRQLVHIRYERPQISCAPELTISVAPLN
jgi:hypothetical protein